MRKLLLFTVAILMMANFSFGQDLESIDLTASELTTLIKINDIKVIKKGKYNKEVKFEDIKDEDLKEVYKVSEITKSENMVTDEDGTHPEATTQWFITFKGNGILQGFWTLTDPLDGIATKEELAIFMSAGITQGDDEDIPTNLQLDAKFAAKKESNILLPDDDF